MSKLAEFAIMVIAFAPLVLVGGALAHGAYLAYQHRNDEDER